LAMWARLRRWSLFRLPSPLLSTMSNLVRKCSFRDPTETKILVIATEKCSWIHRLWPHKTAHDKTRVLDPDPDWIRIQWLCGSGSGFGIRIHGQKMKKKNALFLHFLNIFIAKRYQVKLQVFFTFILIFKTYL
jgi:hypothetical protein